MEIVKKKKETVTERGREHHMAEVFTDFIFSITENIHLSESVQHRKY